MKKKVICVFNNYSIPKVIKEVNNGESPSHLVFGIKELEKDYNFVFAENLRKPKVILVFIKLFSFFSRIFPLGNLESQVKTWFYRHELDIIYSCCENETNLLQFLRYFGLFNVPIVTIIHHKHYPGRLDFIRFKFLMIIYKGADEVLCLSTSVSKDIISKFTNRVKTRTFNWGPNLNFYFSDNNECNGFITAGRTGRDYDTLLKATVNAKVKLTIIYLDGDVDESLYKKHSFIKFIKQPRVEPIPGTTKGWMKHRELLNHYNKARVAIIPLLKQASLVGLTSLMDCLGAGKAVIVTRNENIDIEIEKEGIGFWVEEGDIEGLSSLLKWFENNPGDAKHMGMRARKLAEKYYNTTITQKRLKRIINNNLK